MDPYLAHLSAQRPYVAEQTALDLQQSISNRRPSLSVAQIVQPAFERLSLQDREHLSDITDKP